MTYLVLSLFPGLDFLGKAFEDEIEGSCVVRGPDLILGQDIRIWSAIPGKFHVVIGGPPCKSFSSVGRWKPPTQGNMIPEFQRVVFEAQPLCWVMENVREAPLPIVKGYATKDYLLNAHHYGANQNRTRRFTFGWKSNGDFAPVPMIPEDPLPVHKRTPNPFPTVLASEGKFPTNCAGRKIGRRFTIAEVCELQGVPEMVNAWCFLPRGKSKRVPYRKEFMYELIGNAVEMRTGRVVARTVKRGLEFLQEGD